MVYRVRAASRGRGGRVPLALVTNDDGVDTVGIRTLARVARDAGLDVVVAAPDRDASGSGASVQMAGEGGGFRVTEREWNEPGLETVRAVEAAPAFIVRAALWGAFGPPPDLVLSGINHGPNYGRAVLHSGTVGAALTAATQGVPAAALSMETGVETHWDTARRVATAAVEWLLDVKDAVAFNVNIPNRPWEQVGGLTRARLAPVGSVEVTITEAGAGLMRLQFHDTVVDLQPGTDAAYLADGMACVTPLRAVTEADDVSTTGLEHLVDRLAAPKARPIGDC